MIRPATWDDRAAILELIVAMGGHEQIAGHQDPLRRFGAVLATPDARTIVAECDGRVVGYIELHAYDASVDDRREVRLSAVTVAPDARRTGIGAALLDAAEREARALGASAMVLESSQWRTDAHAFYRAQGFREKVPAMRFVRAVGAASGSLEERFLAAAAAAASAIRASIAGLADASALRMGADGAPTEAADAAAEAAALAHLLPLGVPVVSEEAGLVGAVALDPARPWISLDPLDGSRNFVAGYPMYATSMALVCSGRTLAALVVDLVSGQRWCASAGGGAWRDGRPIRVRASRLIAVPSHGSGGSRFPQLVRGERLRISGSSALDLCHVADGSIAAFVGLHRAVVHVHDVAAAELIVREAGGAVVGGDGNALELAPDPAVTLAIVAAADDALVRRFLAVDG